MDLGHGRRGPGAARLLSALHEALAALEPAERVARALPRSPGGPVSVIAIGKAAPAMTLGALGRWSSAIEDALVVTTNGTDARAISRDPRVEVLRAGHPVPDRRSVEAGERCLERARESRGRLLVLVSGGASSLACAPAPSVSLADQQGVTRAMLASGASIQELNVVRRHLSRIKGGGLARAARPVPVTTLVYGDVIGGALADVGSGPGVFDPSTIRAARALLRRYAPAAAGLPLVRTGRADNVESARFVACPEELARLLAGRLRARGFAARVLNSSQAPALELAREYVARAGALPPGAAVVRAAEPAVVVPAHAGRGGRSTHLAALVGRELPPGVVFLAAATDGVDGASGTAGALVTRRALLREGDAIVARALDRFDTGSLHRALGTALACAPTGTNLADVHVLARPRRA